MSGSLFQDLSPYYEYALILSPLSHLRISITQSKGVCLRCALTFRFILSDQSFAVILVSTKIAEADEHRIYSTSMFHYRLHVPANHKLPLFSNLTEPPVRAVSPPASILTQVHDKTFSHSPPLLTIPLDAFSRLSDLGQSDQMA